MIMTAVAMFNVIRLSTSNRPRLFAVAHAPQGGRRQAEWKFAGAILARRIGGA
jgi:hypothetical protein